MCGNAAVTTYERTEVNIHVTFRNPSELFWAYTLYL